MIDYQIQPPTRRCTKTGRELREGERFVSALREQGGSLIREDYALDAWNSLESPGECLAFWQGRVQANKTPRKPVIDDDLLLECFSRLEGQEEPGRVRFRLVLALLLLRRRRFRLETRETQREDQAQEVLVFRCLRTGTRHAVVDPGMTEEQIVAVQEEVVQTLGWA